MPTLAPNDGSNARSRYAIFPVIILCDARLTMTDRVVWAAIDARQTTLSRVRVRYADYAADLDISPRTFREAIARLAALDLVEVTHTGRTPYLAIRNPARAMAEGRDSAGQVSTARRRVSASRHSEGRGSAVPHISSSGSVTSNSTRGRAVQPPLVGVVAPAAASQDDEQTGPSTADVARVVGLLAAADLTLDRSTAADVRAALASSGLSPVALVDLVTRETRAKATSNPAGYARTVLRLVARGDFTPTRPVVDTPTPTPAQYVREVVEPADESVRLAAVEQAKRDMAKGRRNRTTTTRTPAAS